MSADMAMMSVHRRVSAAVFVLGVLIVALGPASWSDGGGGLLIFACAVGLLGEALYSYRLGEITGRHWVWPQKFEAITRLQAPVRFRLFVIAFALLGSFCLVAGLLLIFSTLAKHAG